MKLSYQKQETAQNVRNAVINTSESGSYKFTDALTGEPAEPGSIKDKRDYLKMKDPSPTSPQVFQVRDIGENAYDHILIEFSQEDPELAKDYLETVLGVMTHPDFTWTKDKVDKKVKGVKEAFYDFHDKKNGTYHAHVYLSNFPTIAHATHTDVFGSVTADKASVREQMERQINIALTAKYGNGAELVDFLNARVDMSKSQVSEESKTTAKQIAINPEFDAETYVNTPPSVVNESVLAAMLKNEKRDLEEMVQAIENKKQAVARLQQFEDVNQENIKYKLQNNILIHQNAELTKEVEQVKKDTAAEIVLKNKDIEKAEKSLTDAQELAQEAIEAKGKIQNDLNNANTALAENATKIQELDDLNSELETKLTAEQNASALKDKTISTLTDSLEKANKLTESLELQLTQAQNALSAQSGELATLKNDAQKHAKALQEATEKAQAQEQLAKDAKEALERERNDNAEMRKDYAQAIKDSAASANALELQKIENQTLQAQAEKHRAELKEANSLIDFIAEKFVIAADFIKKITGSLNTPAEKKAAQAITKSIDKVGLMKARTPEEEAARIARIRKEYEEKKLATKREQEVNPDTPKKPKS